MEVTKSVLRFPVISYPDPTTGAEPRHDIQVGRECDVLVMPKSLISSSEFGDRSHSARSTSMNSRPITGVTSNALNWSRAPLSFSGSRWLTSNFGSSSVSADFPTFFPFSSCVECLSTLLTLSTTVVVASVADGAMLKTDVSTMDVVAVCSGHNLNGE